MSQKKVKSLQRQVKKLARDKFRNKMGNVLSIIQYTNAIAGALGYPKKEIEFAGKKVEVYDLGGQGFQALLNELIQKYHTAREREAIQVEEGDTSFDPHSFIPLTEKLREIGTTQSVAAFTEDGEPDFSKAPPEDRW